MKKAWKIPVTWEVGSVMMKFKQFHATNHFNTISFYKEQPIALYKLWLNDTKIYRGYYFVNGEFESSHNENLNRNPQLFDFLLQNWDDLKKEINKEIEKQTLAMFKEVKKQEDSSFNRLSIYQNFKI